MFRRWIIFLVSLLVICVCSFLMVAYLMDAAEVLHPYHDERMITLIGSVGMAAFGLIAISLLARSINQGRLVIFKPLFIKMFEGMTFFKWGVLIIGIIFALSFLEFVRNVTG